MEISFNDQDLSDADREHRIKTHRIVQGYSSSPHKSSFAGTTPGREKGRIKLSDPHIFSSDEDIYHQNNDSNSNKESDEKKGDETSTKISPVGPSSSHHQLEHVINEQNLEAKTLFSQYEEDEENIEDDDENLDGESFKFTRKLRRRSKTRDKLEKAKEQLRQSYMSESYIDQMMSNNSKEKRKSSSVSFSEIQTIEVPEWQESNAPQTYSSTGCSSHKNKRYCSHPYVTSIQADIAVKEQLVSQLEQTDQEYTYMRAQYEQRLADMQEALITLQQERNRRSRYEHEMKRLIQEIGELRRKYNEATQSNATSRNQNETILKSMRAQIEQLRGMMKRMKDEAERVRETTERNQREIQNLRRKEKAAQNE
ncbi:unnamed protein product [Rhizophagus irregularis]|nr:unnamed protein product [Rhizophagus irregularis]